MGGGRPGGEASRLTPFPALVNVRSMAWTGGKVFGIGLNKTGTTSLTHALSVLGYSAVHYHHGELTSEEINRHITEAVHAGEPPLARLPSLQDFDAYFDIVSLVRLFPAFDDAYPGSKFILHTRPLAEWLDSREKHVLRNQRDPHYRGDWTAVDREGWTRERDEHHARVRAYFADRPSDLLEIDLSAGDGWEKLCPFLQCEWPAVPFPKANTAEAPNRRRRGLRPRLGLS